MSVATDLQQIAENVPLVYAAGKQKQYDEFWDEYQVNGARTGYTYAFAGTGWTDKTFTPKYPVNASSGFTCGFAYAGITKILIPLSITVINATQAFIYARRLVTVNSLTVTEQVMFNEWFMECSALENITFYGTIGNSINIHWSKKLSVISAKSILSHLSTNGSGKTVTFARSIQSVVEADAAAATLIATAEANGWTISFT